MAAHAPWAGASCLLRPHSPPLPAAGGAGAAARALLAGLGGVPGQRATARMFPLAVGLSPPPPAPPYSAKMVAAVGTGL